MPPSSLHDSAEVAYAGCGFMAGRHSEKQRSCGNLLMKTSVIASICFYCINESFVLFQGGRVRNKMCHPVT